MDEDARSSLKNAVITYLETNFFLTGAYPSLDDLTSRYSLSVPDFLELYEEITPALENRGLPDLPEYLPPPVKIRTPRTDDYDPMFILAVNLICATADKRSTAAKLKIAGVSNQQWQGFLKVPKNRAYFEKLLSESFRDVEYAAQLALARNVEAGDLQSIKHYQEYTGRYRPNTEMTMNIGIIFAKLMEILSARLDPTQLAEIADEFELALQQPRELTA